MRFYRWLIYWVARFLAATASWQLLTATRLLYYSSSPEERARMDQSLQEHYLRMSAPLVYVSPPEKVENKEEMPN